MAAIQHHFPSTVRLPASPTIDTNELRIALGQPSAALVSLWRKDRNFPVAFRDGNACFCVTTQVESWLHNQGIEVERLP